MIFITDKRSTFGSTLYTNIYSSLSESESSGSGESGSEDSGDDGSDWEEGSQGSPGTSDSEEETGKEEDKEIIPGRNCHSFFSANFCHKMFFLI